MQLDLNLLTALDALLEEGSVAGAAARLHVTAPAMSRSLGRIRKATGDQILVRTGRSMVPTSRALAMRADVHALVQQAHHLLSAQQELDLTALDRVFTVRWHDALTAACGTALTTAVHRQAPGVRLRLSAEPGSDDAELRRGEVDLESSSSRPTLPDIRHRHVGTDRLVVAVRAGHPLAEGLLNPEDYAAAEHLTISRRGSLHDPIDDALATHGLERRVVAAGPTAAFALRLARETDWWSRSPTRSPADPGPTRPAHAVTATPGARGLVVPAVAPALRGRPRPHLAARPGHRNRPGTVRTDGHLKITAAVPAQEADPASHPGLRPLPS